MVRISVVAVPGGWAVHASMIDNALVFLSGARAEQAARRLVQAVLALGHAVALEIRTRDGFVVFSDCRQPAPWTFNPCVRAPATTAGAIAGTTLAEHGRRV